MASLLQADRRSNFRAPRVPRPGARVLGFTLAEVVVSLVLLAWGALALVAASAGAVRVVAEGEAQERATAAARNRIEQVAARGCSTPADSSSVDSSLGIRERWTVSPARNGVRLVTDTVDYGDHAATRTVVLERLILC
jgi:Tfp pilus assembly protein PilV